MNDADQRLAEMGDAGKHRLQTAAVLDIFLAAVILHAAHPVEVAPGAEGFAVAGKHREPHLGVSVKLAKDLG